MNGMAIVVPSCDRYSDLWIPFFEHLTRVWPDVPFPVYLVANERPFAFPGVQVIHVGKDRGWSSNLLRALEKIPAEGIFLCIDDLFPASTIARPAVEHLARRFLSEKMNYLRLNPRPGPVGSLDADGVGALPPGDPYRSATVSCLWRRQVLLDVLREGETAWDFEITGADRTDRYDAWFASSRWLFPTYNLVVKGLYDPVVRRQLARQGVSLQGSRGEMTPLQYLAFRARLIRHHAFQLLPRGWQRRIRLRFRVT